jgi:hypothetical protein
VDGEEVCACGHGDRDRVDVAFVVGVDGHIVNLGFPEQVPHAQVARADTGTDFVSSHDV